MDEKTLIRAALREDLNGRGDVTTKLFVPPDARFRGRIRARQAGVVCGARLARDVFKACDPRCRVRILVADGGRVRPGQAVLEISGGRGVLTAERTAPGVAQRAAAFVRRIDKLPLPVRDAPGFLVNAVLAPYLHEAMRCVDEGIAPETVDAAMLAFGMPMGPIELADTVGLDAALATGRLLVGEADPPRRLTKLVAAGHLGKKSGKGFYAWIDGKAQRIGAGATANPALAQRMLKPLLAATQRLVQDGIVADAELADAGVIFGTGFAPYTGGPMNYLQSGER